MHLHSAHNSHPLIPPQYFIDFRSGFSTPLALFVSVQHRCLCGVHSRLASMPAAWLCSSEGALHH